MDIWYRSKRLGAGAVCVALAVAPYIPETAPYYAYMQAIQAGLGALGVALVGRSKYNESRK